MGTKRIVRDRHLTSAEVARLDETKSHGKADVAAALSRLKTARAGATSEPPGPTSAADLVALNRLISTLRAAREEQGLSLADLTERTGIDRSALSRLENRRNINPTYATITRYAAAVGMRMTFELTPAAQTPTKAGRRTRGLVLED